MASTRIKSYSPKYYFATREKAEWYLLNGSYTKARLTGLFTKLPSKKYRLGLPIIKNINNN